MERMSLDVNKMTKDQLRQHILMLAMQLTQLEEENKNLKSDLEQFSEAYKRYRDFEKEELAESCYDLEKENKKLKEELSKYKEQYEHSMGEDDELIYEEGLYD